MKILLGIIQIFQNIISGVSKSFDMRDFFVYGGLVMAFVGLFMFMPWVAFTAIGFVMLIIGIFILSIKGKK